MPADPGELHRLRTALRDLVALSTIPAAWVGREPSTIAAGLTVGDILLDANGRAVTDPEILAEVLDDTAIGAAVRFRVARGGALREVEIHIGERPRRTK